MSLIDLTGLIRNAMWVLGLAIAVATWSYLTWWAAARQVSVRQAAGLPLFQAPLSLGLALFSASLAWSADRIWERGLWILLGLAFTGQIVLDWRRSRRHGWDGQKGTAHENETA